VKKGFTLAEVLITLGIIGVVAALTMPSLIAKYKEKATVVKVKKAYSVLSQAYTRALNDYGQPADWDLGGYASADGAQKLRDILGGYMVKVRNGISINDYGSVTQLDGTVMSITARGTDATLTLSDGTTIAFFVESADCSQNVWGTDNYANVCAQITVITDKKLQAGINYFPFYLTDKGIVPMGGQGSTRDFEVLCRRNKTTSANGWGCTAWVVINENMDYLHCDDLSWSGKTKCD